LSTTSGGPLTVVRRRGTAGLLGPRYRRLTLGVLMVSTFIAFEQMSVATALPAVLRHLGDVSLYGWAFSAFMLGQVVGIILAGPAVDRIGLARPLLAAGAGFSAGLLIDGTAPSMLVLVVGRAVQGVGAGVITVTLNSAVGRTIDDELRPRAFAAMAVAWVLPSIVGPPIAGVIAQDLTWRLVFLGIVPAVVIGLIIAVPALSAAESARGREAPTGTAGRGWLHTIWLGFALAVGTILALGALGSDPALAVVLGAAGLAILIYSIRTLLPSPAARGGGRQRGAMFVGGFAAASFFGAEAFLPLALTSIHHRSLTEAGVVLTMAAVAWTSGSWAQVHLRQRLGARRLCAIGLLLIAAGVLGVLAIDWAQTPWWVAFIGWALAPAGMGIITTTVTLVIVSGTDGGPLGEPVASLQVLQTLGTAIITGIGGAALAWSVHLGHGRAPGIAGLDMLAALLAIGGLMAVPALPGPAGPPPESSAPANLVVT
jgi:MFS family permease